MNFLKLLFYIGLILTIAMTAYATEENHSNRTIHDPFPYNITLTHSDIHYIEHIEENNVSFHGECHISFKINIAMHHIDVYLKKIEVDESKTTLYNVNSGVIYRLINHIYITKENYLYLVFTFNEELSPGSYMLYMKFFGNSTINYVKSLQTSHIAKERERLWANIMAVPLVAITGRKIPCLGNPHTISISVKHNHTFKAFSHMPIKYQHKDHDGMVLTHFNTTPPMSICKVIVVLTDFDYAYPYANKTINTWCRSHLTWHVKYAQRVAKTFTEYMAHYARKSKIFPEINQIIIPDIPRSRASALGIIFYNESDITYDDTTDSTYRQMEVAKILTSHISNQWFGELVSPLNNTDIWLKEGLASFFEMYISDKIFPDFWRVIDSNVVDTLQGCLSEDTGSTMSPVYGSIYTIKDKHTLFDEEFIECTPYHDKAQVILRMLQHAVTDEVFQNGTLTYLNTHQFKTVTSNDLWSAIGDMQNISSRFIVFDVKEVMDTWMNQRHYPLIIVMRNYESGETTVLQNDFCQPSLHLSALLKMWWVPITFATTTNPTFDNTETYDWLSPSKSQIHLHVNPNDWIIVNVQQVGYYRVAYDIWNWRKIIQYLKSEEYIRIHVLNRAQIIDDAFALITRGIWNIIGISLPPQFLKILSFDLFTFFELMSYLSQETDYIAWFPVFRNLAKMSKYFPLPESEFFRSRMADVFDTPFTNVWQKDRNDDIFIILKKLKISKWACLVGNVQCKRKATAILNYYLADTENHKLSYRWQNWTYCSGLMAANRNTWDKIMDLYMQKRDKNLLEFLACSENSNIIINYLNIISSNNSTMQEEDRVFAFKHIIIKHARNDQVLHHMLQNFESVKPISLITATLLEDIIFNVYTEGQLEKIKDTVKYNMDRKIFTAIEPVIESRLIALRNLINSFSTWFIKKEKEA